MTPDQARMLAAVLNRLADAATTFNRATIEDFELAHAIQGADDAARAELQAAIEAVKQHG